MTTNAQLPSLLSIAIRGLANVISLSATEARLTKQSHFRLALNDLPNEIGSQDGDCRQCRGIEDGKSLYSDDNHLSRLGAIKEIGVLAAAFRDSNSARAP